MGPRFTYPFITSEPSNVGQEYSVLQKSHTIPDSKVHGTNMGPIWGLKDPGGPHVGPMNFAI